MLILQKNSKFYYGVFYIGRKHKWICLKTDREKDAQDLHDSIQARLKQQSLKSRVDVLLGNKSEKPRTLLIQDVEKKYMEVNQNYSKTGLKIWNLFKSWLKDDWIDISDIDTAKALQYLSTCQSSGKWHNNCKSALSKIWTTLKPFSDIQKNIWQEIPNKRKDSVNFRPFSKQEIDAILKVTKGNDWHDAIMLSLYTGLRKTDVLNLTKENMKNGYIEILPAKTASHGKSVYIPIHPAIEKIIKARSKTGKFFLKRERAYEDFEKYLKLAEIEDTKQGIASFHSLRTTFITQAEEQGVPRHVIQGIVGHASPAMTEHYSHDKESAKVITKLVIR